MVSDILTVSAFVVFLLTKISGVISQDIGCVYKQFEAINRG